MFLVWDIGAGWLAAAYGSGNMESNAGQLGETRHGNKFYFKSCIV